jgi:ABC transporter
MSNAMPRALQKHTRWRGLLSALRKTRRRCATTAPPMPPLPMRLPPVTAINGSGDSSNTTTSCGGALRPVRCGACERLLAALNAVGLGHLSGYLPFGAAAHHPPQGWAAVLSPGEQQRLAFARLLLAAPALAVLDEATSALPEDDAVQLYRTLAASGIRAYISVVHGQHLTDEHAALLRLDGAGGWEFEQV